MKGHRVSMKGTKWQVARQYRKDIDTETTVVRVNWEIEDWFFNDIMSKILNTVGKRQKWIYYIVG